VNSVLLTAGVASIILAVVGGGAKAFGVEVPVLDKRSRQMGLAIVGVLFLVGSYVLRENGDTQESTDVAAYRQEVLATCRSIQNAGSNPVVAAANGDGTFDRDRLIQGLRSQVRASRDVFTQLWERPIPAALEQEAREAQKAVNRLLARTKAQIDEIPSKVPARLTFQELAALFGQLDAALRAPASRLEGAMARLAGQPCSIPAPTSNP
jgi:hypothetical protein